MPLPLIHTPQALEVEERGGGGGGPGGGGGGELPKPNHLVPAASIEAPKRRETMPIYLSRQVVMPPPPPPLKMLIPLLCSSETTPIYLSRQVVIPPPP